MRTTITIDDRLLDEVRARARAVGQTPSAFILDRSAGPRRACDGSRAGFRLVTFGAGGPAQGVDLDRTSELLSEDARPRR